MRAFILLSLAAFVSADVGGYNYQQQSGGGGGGGGVPSIGGIGGTAALTGIQGGIGSLGGGGGGGGGGLGGLGGGSGGLGGIGGGIGSSSLGGGGGGGGSGGVGGPVSFSGGSAPAELNKEFYSFSAPEQEFDDQNANQQIASSIKKNLRVVFIRTPENHGLEQAALNLAKQAADDKTAIYVLSKQADIGNLAQQLQNIKSQSSNKPEVHFVKYRTPQDAANAQQAIQQQYDQLGGTSQSHNGGVAPVINFASQAPIRQVTPQSPNNAYLPSSVLRRFRL